MNARKYKIGIFDSGLGGLTIAKAIMKALPQYDYVYLGDNAHVPYGARSQRVVYQFTKNAIEELFRRGCALVIIACNTASAEALANIQQKYLPQRAPNRRVLGVIRPAVEEAAKRGKRIGVLATESTVASTAFTQELRKIKPNLRVTEQAAPLLVPIVEAGENAWTGTSLILKKYLKRLKKKNIDTLILGCTHYALLKNKIKKEMGKKARLICEDKIVPGKLKGYLARHPELEKMLSRGKKRAFLVTDKNKRFERLTRLFMGRKIELQLIEL